MKNANQTGFKETQNGEYKYLFEFNILFKWIIQIYLQTLQISKLILFNKNISLILINLLFY